MTVVIEFSENSILQATETYEYESNKMVQIAVKESLNAAIAKNITLTWTSILIQVNV